MQEDGREIHDVVAGKNLPPAKNRFSGMSDGLLEMVAPAEENPVFELLVRRWRKNLHCAPDRTLALASVLAVVSARLTETGSFSFFIWHALFYAFALRTGFVFCGNLRNGSNGTADLLSTPVRSETYIQALRSLFAATALYAAIPYVIYWVALSLMSDLFINGLFTDFTTAEVAAGAALYFCLLTSLLWFGTWCWAAGGWWKALPAAVIPVVVTRLMDSNQILGLEPFPTSPGRWILAFNLFVFGYLISVVLARSLTERVRG